MPLQNLSRIRVDKQDGMTDIKSASTAPRVCIIGTSGKGTADFGYVPATTGVAKSEFGTEGTLLRGMWEARKAGAKEVLMYRMGATEATLAHVGDSTGVGGYTVKTVEKDADGGSDYAIWYDDTNARIVIIRTSDELTVYDNNPGNEIDLFEVTVSGSRAVGGGDDIGSPSGYVNLEDVTATGTVFTAGTDGLSLSKMELYEKLYVAYKNLLDSQFDVVVPMGVFLDDYNIVDQGHYLGAVAPVIPGGQTYPTAGAYVPGVDVDALGLAYVEEYYGEYYFWWRTSTGTFTAADVYPSVGSADSTHKIDGTLLTADDFHEVNFAYQLSRFLYEYSTDIVDATGVIGCLPPESTALVDKARWLGQAPTWTYTSTGEYYIAGASDNGYGLLGNKFKVGRHDHRSGVFGGGFILTDTEFMDGEEQLDDNEVPIDLGKYISVAADSLFLRNQWYNSGYIASMAASYAGFYVNRIPSSAPTNKALPKGMDQVYKFRVNSLDTLVGYGYVATKTKLTGELSIADAPMATLPNSDWRRLSTVRIIKNVIDGVRLVCDPYLGEGSTSATRASMKQAIDNVLLDAKKAGYLNDYGDFEVIQTPSMEVAGEAQITLRLKPAFELRVITVSISVVKTI